MVCITRTERLHHALVTTPYPGEIHASPNAARYKSLQACRQREVLRCGGSRVGCVCAWQGECAGEGGVWCGKVGGVPCEAVGRRVCARGGRWW